MVKSPALNTHREFKISSRIGYGVCAAFLATIAAYVAFVSRDFSSSGFLIFAAVVGGYMALNIGANDAANNVGPAVGSGAMTIGTAIVIAAICEAAGAIIAGGDVVGTIKSGIIHPELVGSSEEFIWLMGAALLAGALWLNLATWLGAPVSTTHSIVGGVLGAGLAAGGTAIANWPVLAAIVASWVISPLMGGVIAAGVLLFIKRAIMYQADMVGAARRVVPGLVACMAWAFGTYLVLKGIKQLWSASFLQASLVGLVAAIAVYWLTARSVRTKAVQLSNTREDVNGLFTVPLIFAAALLSFAHGANDVANAVGPLAAIADAVNSGGIAIKATIPWWVLLIGAAGLAFGLAVFGPKLIRTVGGEITELDKARAYSIVIAAAITVIVASQLGLPVSSTHIALGGIFGVGFLSEFLKSSYARQLHQIVISHEGDDRERVQQFLDDFQTASVEDMRVMLKTAKSHKEDVPLHKKERKRLKKIYHQELVKRQYLYRIVAAWVVTVPASAAMGAVIFFILRGMLFHP